MNAATNNSPGSPKDVDSFTFTRSEGFFDPKITTFVTERSTVSQIAMPVIQSAAEASKRKIKKSLRSPPKPRAKIPAVPHGIKIIDPHHIGMYRRISFEESNTTKFQNDSSQNKCKDDLFPFED